MKLSNVMLALAAAMPILAVPTAEADPNLEVRNNKEPSCGEVYDYCKKHKKKAWCKKRSGGYRECTGELPKYGNKPWKEACKSGKGAVCPSNITLDILGLDISLCIDIEVIIS